MTKQDLTFQSPILNAAGSLGFVPHPRSPITFKSLGAFFTNPISLARRTPATGPRLAPFPAGFLLHTGLPNPGLKSAIRRFENRWEKAEIPIIVHFIAEGRESVRQAVENLEEVEGVMGIELGLPPGIDSHSAQVIIQAAVGELPVIARLPLDRVNDLAQAAITAGSSAISLGPPRGSIALGSGTGIQGRIYGPALFPQALLAVQIAVQFGISVIASGGLYTAHAVQAMLDAGAIAVQLDALFWCGRYSQLLEILKNN